MEYLWNIYRIVYIYIDIYIYIYIYGRYCIPNVAPKQVDYEILAAKHVKDEGLAEMLMCIEHD
jgi:hypothetical protein